MDYFLDSDIMIKRKKVIVMADGNKDINNNVINKNEVDVKKIETEKGFKTEITNNLTGETRVQEFIKDKGVLYPQKSVEVTEAEAGGKIVPVKDNS